MDGNVDDYISTFYSYLFFLFLIIIVIGLFIGLFIYAEARQYMYNTYK